MYMDRVTMTRAHMKGRVISKSNRKEERITVRSIATVREIT